MKDHPGGGVLASTLRRLSVGQGSAGVDSVLPDDGPLISKKSSPTPCGRRIWPTTLRNDSPYRPLRPFKKHAARLVALAGRVS